MRKFLSILFVLALAVSLGTVALAAGPGTVEAPQIDGEDTAPPTVEPEAPETQSVEAADDQPPLDLETPQLDLETPQPEAMCSGGYCSSDRQCQWWYGPYSYCVRESGQSCGYCLTY